MTRETKAGLVVSCSFLCLVAVVLYCKLNGRNPSLGEEYSDSSSIMAPTDPTPIEETSPSEGGSSGLTVASANSGPGLDGGNLSASTSDGGSKSSTTGRDGFSIPNPAGNGNDASVTSSASLGTNSSSDSENKNDSTSTKAASAQGGSTYAIPDAPETNQRSGSKLAGADHKGHSTKDNQAGATLDPLDDLKENYKEANNSSSSNGDTQTSRTTEDHSENSGKEIVKNSEAERVSSTELPNSSGSGQNSNKSQTNDADGGSTASRLDPKLLPGKVAGATTSGVQEPPPIPAGIRNPYQSLPEAPTTTANTSDASNRSPRDANSRKSTVGSSESTGSNATIIGLNRGANGPFPGTSAISSTQGTVPATTPNLTTTGISTSGGSQTPARSQIGGLDREGKVAVVSGLGNGLTPGVMPSPRITGLPPAGDTAPEPNVRLGPPTGGSSSIQPAQSSSRDSASALPPPNQFAQGTAPNLNGQSPGTARPYRTSAPATGPIQPTGFPAAKVDSYDEETYLCKQGDKFEDISTKFYQTDKYAQALLLFNRNHPRATAAVRQDPPSLAAGQSVFIPPLRVLEKQYATAITDHAPLNQGGALSPASPETKNPTAGSPASGAAPAASTGAQNSALPDNRNTVPTTGTGAPSDGQAGGSYTVPGDNRNTGGQYSMPPDNRNVVPPSPLPGALPPTKPPAQGKDVIYQVPKNGETFWEISRKTLGNPNRWSEISRLNPQIKPQYPVPGGTNLKMPADARIDPVAPMPVDRVN